MAINKREIPKEDHKALTDLDPGDEFILFDEKYELIERESEQDDNSIMFDCVAKKVDEEKYFTYLYNYSIYGYKDHAYDSICQDFSFTEVEKRIVPIVRWIIKK